MLMCTRLSESIATRASLDSYPLHVTPIVSNAKHYFAEIS